MTPQVLLVRLLGGPPGLYQVRRRADQPCPLSGPRESWVLFLKREEVMHLSSFIVNPQHEFQMGSVCKQKASKSISATSNFQAILLHM
jgi:hypothetical protein